MVSLQVTLSATSPIVGSASFNEQITVAGNNAIQNIQNVGTDEELLDFGDVSFPTGVVYIENKSAFTLTLSTDDAGANVLATIPADGVPYVTQGMTAAPYAKLGTAGQVQVLVFEP